MQRDANLRQRWTGAAELVRPPAVADTAGLKQEVFETSREGSSDIAAAGAAAANSTSEKSSPLQHPFPPDKNDVPSNGAAGAPSENANQSPVPTSGFNSTKSGRLAGRYQQHNPIPAVLRPGDAILGGTFMLDVVQHMKDLADGGEFFGNTSCTPCSGRNVYMKQMRFYCVQYRQKDNAAPKCAVRLQLRKLRGRPGWVVFKEGDHIHGPLPQNKRSNRFKCLLRSLQDVDRDAASTYTRRTMAAPWTRGEAPLILPNLPRFHPVPVPIPMSAGPGGVIAPRANVVPPTMVPPNMVPPNVVASNIVASSVAPSSTPAAEEVTAAEILRDAGIPASCEMDKGAFDKMVSVVGDAPPALLALCEKHNINFVASQGAAPLVVQGVLKVLSEAMKAVDIATLRKDFCQPARYISCNMKEKNVIVKGSKSEIIARLIAWAKHFLTPFSARKMPPSLLPAAPPASAALPPSPPDAPAQPSGPQPAGAPAAGATEGAAVAQTPPASPLYLQDEGAQELEPPAKRPRTSSGNDDASEENLAGVFDAGSGAESSKSEEGAQMKENEIELKKAELMMKKEEHDLTMRAGNAAAMEKAMALEERALVLEDRCYKMIVEAEKAVNEAGDNATPAMVARVKNLYQKLQRVQAMSAPDSNNLL